MLLGQTFLDHDQDNDYTLLQEASLEPMPIIVEDSRKTISSSWTSCELRPLRCATALTALRTQLAHAKLLAAEQEAALALEEAERATSQHEMELMAMLEGGAVAPVDSGKAAKKRAKRERQQRQRAATASSHQAGGQSSHHVRGAEEAVSWAEPESEATLAADTRLGQQPKEVRQTACLITN